MIQKRAGNDDDAPLSIPTLLIGDKYAQYYWQQAQPYPHSELPNAVLRQNTGDPAGVLRVLSEFRARFPGTLLDARRNHREWRKLVSAITEYARGNPLERLQRVGAGRVTFLYDIPQRRSAITLKHGIAFCFRKYHSLITDLVKGAWANYVRQFNAQLLGDAADLHYFLFGCDRANLDIVRPIVREFQSGRCFYCRELLNNEAGQVDHFIPWSRYPVDLGHNFVVAHATCNAAKSDRLPAVRHLDEWVMHNQRLGAEKNHIFGQHGIIHSLAASARIIHWAYGQTSAFNGLTWIQKKDFEPLPADWNHLLMALLN